MAGVVKTYPYGAGFQTKVIAGCLLEPKFLASYRDVIQEEYFDSEVHQVIIREGLSYWDENGRAPSFDTLKLLLMDHSDTWRTDNEFREKVLSLLAQIERQDMSDFSDVSNLVIEFGRTRKMEGLTKEIARALSSGESVDSVWELIDRARVTGSSAAKVVDIAKDLVEATAVCQANGLYNSTLKVPTGFPTLDNAFNGGLGRREVGIILGTTGIGKSSMLVNLGAQAIIAGHPVIHVSIGELERDDLFLRYATRLSGIESTDIINGTAPNYKNLMLEYVERYNPRIFAEYFPPRTRIAAIRSYVSRCKYLMGEDPVLLIIDSASDLAASRRFQSSESYEELGEVYTELKSLAHDFDVAVWTDSQTNRLAKRMDTADYDVIADSMKKAHKADVILSVNQNIDEYQQGRLRIFVAKARRYARKQDTITCNVNYGIMLVNEIMA